MIFIERSETFERMYYVDDNDNIDLKADAIFVIGKMRDKPV